MGMYTTINGHEVKYSGLLALAIHNIGIREEFGTLTIPWAKIPSVIGELVSVIENEKLLKDGQVMVQDILRLQTACGKLVDLIEWVSSGVEEDILFG